MANPGEEKLRYRSTLLICAGKSCSKLSDPEAAKRYFKERIREEGLKEEVRAVTCSCLDYCDDAPNVAVYPVGTVHKGVREQDWPELFRRHLARK